MRYPSPDSEGIDEAMSAAPDFTDREQLFRRAVAAMEQQWTARREQLRAAVRTGGVPLSGEIVARLAELPHEDVHSLLSEHPGYKASERLGSYTATLRVFERAAHDLIRAIEQFEVAAQGDILGRNRAHELEDMEHAIQKELFAAASAAHALVDHSRRLQPLVNVPHYREKLAECFGTDGLHEFVIDLRNILHHMRMLKAGWRIENRFEHGKRASFTLSTTELRNLVAQSESMSKGKRDRILVFLSASPEIMNLKEIFHEYRRRSGTFHAWYRQALASDNLAAVRDYERCLRESRNFASRTFWRAMLGNWLNWKQPPNPYDHLGRFLSAEEIAQVYRLPMQSEEQVDRVIQFMDPEKACDADLRRMAYELFRRAAPPAALQG
jgi:hypothetical protein